MTFDDNVWTRSFAAREVAAEMRDDRRNFQGPTPKTPRSYYETRMAGQSTTDSHKGVEITKPSIKSRIDAAFDLLIVSLGMAALIVCIVAALVTADEIGHGRRTTLSVVWHAVMNGECR